MRAVRFELFTCLWLLACETIPHAIESPSNAANAETSNAPSPTVTPDPRPMTLPKAETEEPGTRQFWVNPSSEAAEAASRLQETHPKEAAWLKELAEQPTAFWFTAQVEAFSEAERLSKAVGGSDQYAVAVIAALPQPDCARYTNKGLAPEAYRRWIWDIARGLGETPIYLIVEPEALLLTACLSEQALNDRLNLIAEAVLVLKKNPRAQVYIAAGYPGWLSVEEAVVRLLKAGVLTVDGFALNVAQYLTTEDCIAYGQAISQRIGGKSYIIDTARNGKGPGSPSSWCNPRDRAIGQKPQAPTGIKGLDAYLWIKKPGTSDGACNGGPAAGQWWEKQAIELMRNAERHN